MRSGKLSFEVNFLRFSGSHIKTKGFWIGFFIKWISVLSMALKIKKRTVLSFIYGFLSTGLCFAGDQAEGIPEVKPLTEEERNWLSSYPDIKLAPDPEFKPIEFIDEMGK